MKTIAFIGDSIVEGSADDEHGGWTRRLAAGLPGGWQALHAGVGGDTIVHVVQRVARDVLAHTPDIIVLAVGINDSRRHAGGRYEVTLEDFERGLADFAACVQACGADVLVAGLTPVDEPRTLPIAEDLYYTEIAAGDYDAALRRFAAAQGYRYAPLREAFAAAGGAEQLTADGLHPTPAGHALIAEALRAALEGWL